MRTGRPDVKKQRRNPFTNCRALAKEAAHTPGMTLAACPYFNPPYRTVWLNVFMKESQVEMPFLSESQAECTICSGSFDLDAEGGIEGFIGMLPVAFCPTCKAGIFDFAEQMSLPRECPHCGKFEDDDDDQPAGLSD